jgi:hypothetical protein
MLATYSETSSNDTQSLMKSDFDGDPSMYDHTIKDTKTYYDASAYEVHNSTLLIYGEYRNRTILTYVTQEEPVFF